MNTSLFNLFFRLAHRNSFLDSIIVFLSKNLVYLLVAGLLLWIFLKLKGRLRIFVVSEFLVAVILSRGLITEWMRFFYAHPRPFDALGIQNLIPESGNSFPSGHMTFLFALGMALFYYNHKLGSWFMGLSLVVGLARISAGVHWPLDILGGIAIGILSAAIIHKIFKPYLEKITAPKEPEKAEEVVVEAQNP